MSATPTRRWAVEPPADSRLTQRRQSPTQIHRTRRTRTRRRKLRTPSHPTRPRHTPPDGRPVARIPTHRNRAMGYRKDRQMTTTAEIERALITALDTIRDNWHTLTQPTSGSGEGGSKSADSITGLDRRISLRHETNRTLKDWASVIVRELKLTDDLPLDTDTL